MIYRFSCLSTSRWHISNPWCSWRLVRCPRANWDPNHPFSMAALPIFLESTSLRRYDMFVSVVVPGFGVITTCSRLLIGRGCFCFSSQGGRKGPFWLITGIVNPGHTKSVECVFPSVTFGIQSRSLVLVYIPSSRVPQTFLSLWLMYSPLFSASVSIFTFHLQFLDKGVTKGSKRSCTTPMIKLSLLVFSSKMIFPTIQIDEAWGNNEWGDKYKETIHEKI